MELSEIALQKLLQLFPELSSYIVSFRDITEEAGKEDSGLQIGIFILQFGMEYYYVPVIVKNETVLPIDSLFNATEGTFAPLSRTYIEKIISSSQVYLGKATKIPPTVSQNPSVQDLVVPPRTGKYVYASSSRLVEFLAIMPNMVKKAMIEKFSSDKEVYSSLHRLFGLENLLAALKESKPVVSAQQKPAVQLITEGSGLDNRTVKEILEKGYSLKGTHTTERVAVLANDSEKLGPLKQVSGSDAGYDYEVITRNGDVRSGFVPKKLKGSASQKAVLLCSQDSGHRIPMFVIFSDGNFATSSTFVTRGEPSEHKNVMRELFAYKDAVTPKGVFNYENIAVFTPNLELIGAYRINKVAENSFGITLHGYSLVGDQKTTINAYRNCTEVNVSDPSNIFIPINTLIAKLERDISDTLEVNVNAALAKLELGTLTALGTAVNLGYDGIEFTVDGKPVGGEIKMAEYLVISEGIAPEKAESFIKQAKENRFAKIYLSKKADFEPGEIPQYGDIPESQPKPFGVDEDKRFQENLKSSIGTQDAQTVESMVISELLQATDMTSLVREYLPDISTAIDKLGRTLFLARLNMDKLSNSQNSNEVMSFIANLRNVYRLLGDNAVKLERMVSGPEEAQEEAGEAQ